jgi:hypothetical protein
LTIQTSDLHLHLHVGGAGHAGDGTAHLHGEATCSDLSCDEATIAVALPDASRIQGHEYDIGPLDLGLLVLVLAIVWLALPRQAVAVACLNPFPPRTPYLLAPPLRAPPA